MNFFEITLNSLKLIIIKNIGLLKKYLLELPDSPIPQGLQKAFHEAVDQSDELLRLNYVYDQIQLLPLIKTTLLSLLLPLFCKVYIFYNFN